MLLAGDIGGTRSRLTLFARSERGARIVRHEIFESRKYRSLDQVLRTFLGTPGPRVSAAAFGIAGPVIDGRCEVTNLGWLVDARALERKFRIGRVTLLNDLVALAVGALGVPKRKLRVLGAFGAPRSTPKKHGRNIAVIAAGTGLGEAMLVWDERGARFVPSPTEGGHTDFAPNDELEDDLLRFLRARFGAHVSWERVLSGDGLGNLYDFFVEARAVGESAENARTVEAAEDRNAAIAQLAMDERSEAARQAMERFAALYGAEAGNLALKTTAVGGVYVCGNIAVRALSVLERGSFRRAFEAKGRAATLLERVPIAVVLDSDVGLAGAVRVALEG